MNSFRFTSANADFVTDYLAIGGDLAYDTPVAVEQAVELADLAGITHVLDARMEAEESLWDRFPEVSYLWDGIDDAGQQVPASWFSRITDWADAAIDGGGTVLAHCHMGINRGPSAGYAILLRRGWDPIDAIDLVRNARPQAVVAYAEDALEWHMTRTRMAAADRSAFRKRLSMWRTENPLSLTRAIRTASGRDIGHVA